MTKASPTSFWHDIFTIVAVSVFLALVYNVFSPKSLPLIRKPPVKILAADSMLFSQERSQSDLSRVDSSKQIQRSATISAHQDMKEDHGTVLPRVKREKQVGYKIVSLEQVNRLIGEHRGVLLDGREAEEYDKGHIKGARNIPYLEIDKHFDELMNIPHDTLVIVYCSNPECSLGRDLADFMNQMEFHHLYLYDEGWDAWEKAGMPAEQTSRPGK